MPVFARLTDGRAAINRSASASSIGSSRNIGPPAGPIGIFATARRPHQLRQSRSRLADVELPCHPAMIAERGRTATSKGVEMADKSGRVFERHKQPWTLDELEKLKRLAVKGMGLKAIAKALTRSEESTQAKAREIGLKVAKLR